jgi:RNA polymerase sigma-B factor
VPVPAGDQPLEPPSTDCRSTHESTASPAIRSKADPLARGRVGDVRLVQQHRRGNRHARDVLIERYLPLSRRLASRYDWVDEPREDLIQVAAVGLVKAVDRWDPDRGLAFSSFAVPTILGELRRHFRDVTWDVRPPRGLQELCAALSRARAQVHAATGREATVTDLADRLDRSPVEIEEAMLAASCRRVLSLETPTQDGDENPGTIGDDIGDDDAGYAQAEARIVITRLLSILTDRELEVLRLRYHDGLSQREIAERIGCSQVHVSRMLRKSIDALALQSQVAA